MRFILEKLKKFLIDLGYISQADLELAQKEAQQQNKTLEETLVKKSLISNEQLDQCIAKMMNFKFINLKKEGIDNNAFQIIPEQTAVNKLVIAFGQTKEGIKIAMRNPQDLELINLLEKKTGKKIFPHYATKKDIKTILNIYSQDFKKEYEKIIARLIKQKNNAAKIRQQAIKNGTISQIDDGFKSIIQGIRKIDKILK